MKMKSIVSICKHSKIFYLFDDENGMQWLGDGGAIYPLLKMPPLNPENIFTVFDIPGKQAIDMFVKQKPIPESIDLQDVAKCEEILTPHKMEIRYNGRIFQSFHTSQGIQFIDKKYLAPLSDYKDMLQLYERKDKDGRIYIAAKNGLLLVAVIMPFKVIDEKFVEEVRIFTQDCEKNLKFQQERERKSE